MLTDNSFKRNTIHVPNIETIAIDFNDPESMYLKEEARLYDKLDYDTLLSELDKFDELDVQVLRGDLTRREAANLLGLRYKTYQKRLWRKMKKIKEKRSPNA